MARHYSTRDFFRQIPNALLKRFFEAQGVFGDLDFAALPETKPDVLFAAWLGLTEGQRPQQASACNTPCWTVENKKAPWIGAFRGF